jgi:Ribosomal protein L13
MRSNRPSETETQEIFPRFLVYTQKPAPQFPNSFAHAAYPTPSSYYKHIKTFSVKPHGVERKWHVIDAKGKILGKFAIEAARLLGGKRKPIFTSHVDTGDFVVVINISLIVVVW